MRHSTCTLFEICEVPKCVLACVFVSCLLNFSASMFIKSKQLQLSTSREIVHEVYRYVSDEPLDRATYVHTHIVQLRIKLPGRFA